MAAAGNVPAPGDGPGPSIKGLHHAAFRCRDSEETRRSTRGSWASARGGIRDPADEDGPVHERPPYLLRNGRRVVHGFLRGARPSVRVQGAARLRPPHRARGGAAELEAKFEQGRTLGIETRGIADHGFIRSIYFRDPNGYVVELSARKADAASPAGAGERTRAAHDALDEWQRSKEIPGAGRRPPGRGRPVKRRNPREKQA